jgi:Protein of unknown function (DUF1214)
MAGKMVGACSQYAAAFVDADPNPFDGANTYRPRLTGYPFKTFWSLVVYDDQTRSMLQTDQRFPSIGSQRNGLETNTDTFVDVYFGPEPPLGHEGNGCRPGPARAGTSSCLSTAHSSHGSTRPGDPTRSKDAANRTDADLISSASKRVWLVATSTSTDLTPHCSTAPDSSSTSSKPARSPPARRPPRAPGRAEQPNRYRRVHGDTWRRGRSGVAPARSGRAPFFRSRRDRLRAPSDDRVAARRAAHYRHSGTLLP